jgi:NAD(P)-dependent dehydrogenase (short-subunit alcohol dehydrogenase family)
VPGGGQGIGRAIAFALSDAGAVVGLCARSGGEIARNAVSKAALIRLTENLSAETASEGAKVFAVIPGLVRARRPRVRSTAANRASNGSTEKRSQAAWTYRPSGPPGWWFTSRPEQRTVFRADISASVRTLRKWWRMWRRSLRKTSTS